MTDSRNRVPACGMSKFWEFEPYVEGGAEDIVSYIERFGHYWNVTQIDEEELKTSALITAIGKRAYKTLKDLLLPAKPEDPRLQRLGASTQGPLRSRQPDRR